MKDIERLRDNERILNHLDIMSKKEQGKYMPIGLLEFHPYDRCPLSCLFCTYHSEKSSVYKYKELEKLKIFNPRAIVISGGGEPVFYNDGKYIFDDLVRELRRMFPIAQMGLTTNGQVFPPGTWHKEFDWVRVSVDTDNEKTFKIIKDGELSKSIDTLRHLLKLSIKHVGVGFVYSRFNVSEIYGFLRMLYEDVYLKEGLENRDKLNIQFRPTCMIESCGCPSENYRITGQLMVPDKREWWKESVEIERKKILEDDHEFISFVFNYSNLNKFTLFDCNNSTPTFEKCWTSLARVIVRANGDMFPCVMRACNDAKPLGNILETTNIDEVYYNQMLYHNLINGYCGGDRSCCRIDGQKNSIVDNYVKHNGFQNIYMDENSNINYFF